MQIKSNIKCFIFCFINCKILLPLYISKINHMAILTEKKQNKIKQHAEIKANYEKMMQQPGSQKHGCYELLSKSYGYSVTTIGRIVGNIKPNKKKQ